MLALASQAAIAIENARLYHSLVTQNQELSRARRDLERRQRELNALYEVEKELSAALDLDDLLSRILAQAITVLGGGAGSIALVEPDGALRFRTVQGPAAPRLIERTLPHGTGLLGWSIAHQHAARRRRSGERSAPRRRHRAGDRRARRSTSWSRRSSTART